MAKYNPNKEKKKHFVQKIQDTEGGNFGKYQEGTGGGHPFEAGNTNTRTTRENGKKRQAENPKTNQPRTADGKFTYKSVNGKSIDPKYGPSRGKTVNPLLTGGDNGVYIRESTYDHDVYSNGYLIHKKGETIKASEHNVEEDFAEQSGAYWDKYKDKWYETGGKIITVDLSTQVSSDAIWEQAKKAYNEELKEFMGESEDWFETKFGKKSKTEQAAIEQVQKTGKQAPVIGADGGIEKYVKGGNKAVKDFIQSKKQPVSAPVSQPSKPAEPVSAPAQAPVKEDKPWGKTGTFTESQKDAFVEELKKTPDYDPDFFTDEFIEEFMLENKDQILGAK